MKKTLVLLILLLVPFLARAQELDPPQEPTAVEEPAGPTEPDEAQAAEEAEGMEEVEKPGGADERAESGEPSEPLTEAVVAPPQASFSGGIQVEGTIDAKSGVRFLDGTVQLTAAVGSAPGLTANAGLYDNRVVEFSPALPYVEVCFLNGDLDFDIHVNGGDSTMGGNCLPGDVGWVIEREERVAAFWEDARAECLVGGMRLPEPFEFLFSCRRDAQLGLLDMTGNYEWASNHAELERGDPADGGIGVAIVGNESCGHGIWGWVARAPEKSETRPYRCVR